MADAKYFEMAKEWVPRSHVVGAYGTMSRQVGGRVKIFSQYIEEEAADVAGMKGRPDQNGTCVELAFIQCKNSRDGRLTAQTLNDIMDDGFAGEAFHALFEVASGDSGPQSPSVHILVSVGSTSAFVDARKSIDEALSSSLKQTMKSYNSVVFCNAATQEMRDVVAELMKPGAVSKSKYNIDIASDFSFSIPEGHAGVARFCKTLGQKLVIRVEELAFEDADAFKKYQEALGVIFAADHRLTYNPAYRVHKGKSVDPEMTSVIAFTLKKSETEFMTLTFDDADIMAQDTEVEASSGEVKDGFAAIKMSNMYYLGAGSHEVVKNRIREAKARNFFASAPKVVFGDHYS